MLKAVAITDPSAAVDSVTNSDGTLTISPNTGAVIASLALSHANSWAGQQTFTNPIVGTQTTTDNSTLAASTAYVTTAVANAIAGVDPAISVKAATTQASDTSGLTYLNGVAGVGATLTGSVNTALTFDGQTLTALLQRVLVKNDTQSPSGAYNGVYYLTQLQTAILPPILTRALDYNTSTNINNTGAIPVISGTANANTSWLLTTTVTTVGTDPLTYAQFSYAPSSLPTLSGTNVFTGSNTFTNSLLKLLGSSTGLTTFTSDNSGASNFTMHVPAANDTLAAIAASQAFTNKTYNGNTWTAGTGTLTLAASKTLTCNNTLTFAGTDAQTFTFPATTSTVLTLGNTASLTVGFSQADYNAGTKSSGTFTPDETNGNLQRCTNGGAFTLAPPTNNTSLIIEVTNNGSAGTITTSGFTKVVGDTLTTTNTSIFNLFITKFNGHSLLNVVAMQ